MYNWVTVPGILWDLGISFRQGQNNCLLSTVCFLKRRKEKKKEAGNGALKTIFSLSVQPVQGRADGDGVDRDWRRRDGPRRLHRESSRQFDDGNHQGIDDAIKLIFATTDGVP